MKPRESFGVFKDLQPQMLEELVQLVEIESPTTHKNSVDRMGQELAVKFSDVGMSIDFDPQPEHGNHLIARWGATEPKILILGHMDTVWELGIFEKLPIRIDGDVATGPGIFDMKAGLIILLYALRLLKRQGFNHTNLTVLVNTDEEEGSETSRNLIEHEARSAKCSLVLEPGGPHNSLKTKRRGVGRFKITTHGRSAHAGVEPEKGINAVTELAHQILKVQSWNQDRNGVSINVGIVEGGTRSNVIPAQASAIIDVRCDAPEDMEWLEEKFRDLPAVHPEATVVVSGSVGRPPLVRSESVVNLFQQAAAIAQEFDYPLTEYFTGGGSDGNFTSALGVPTLDGMGAEGGGAHALSEHILISSLPRRANLLYQMLRLQIEEGFNLQENRGPFSPSL